MANSLSILPNVNLTIGDGGEEYSTEVLIGTGLEHFGGEMDIFVSCGVSGRLRLF